MDPFHHLRLALVACLGLAGEAQGAELLSVNTSGTNSCNVGVGEALFVSADGRYAAFNSGSTNIVMPDTNGLTDVFVRDCVLHSNIWGSVAARGSIGGNGSFPLGLTPDGRFLLFGSSATNLVPGATAGTTQLYRQDLLSNVTVLVTVSTNGVNASSSSVAGTTTALKVKRISADGRFVVFLSQANDLSTNASTGSTIDAFCRDVDGGTTELITAGPDGQATDRNVVNCFMSTNGRYFAFDSPATNVVSGLTNATGRSQVYWRDRLAGTNVLVSMNATGGLASDNALVLSLSPDGRYVCFNCVSTNIVSGQNDNNGVQDIFLRDMLAGETWLVTRATNGNATASRVTGGEFSANGEWLVVAPTVADLVTGVQDVNSLSSDLYLHHLPTRTNLLVSRSLSGLTGASQSCDSPFATVSACGRYLAFSTIATNLWAGGTTSVNRLLLRDCAAEATFNPVGGNYVTLPYNEARFVISGDEHFLFFLASENYDPTVTDENKSADLFRVRLRAAELQPCVLGGPIQGRGLALGTYILQTSSNLLNWTDAVTNITDSNGVFSVSDPQPPGPQRYFRLKTP